MKHLKFYSKLKSVLFLFTISTFTFMVACSPANQKSEKSQQIPALPQNQEQVPAEEPVTVEPADNENAEQTSPEQKNAEVMLNPPHGEPYHRCDIPVGAPLDSEPANRTRQTINSAETSTTPASSLANNPTAPTIENARRMNGAQTRNTTPPPTGSKPELNPPHGQPWHRCDIAVGSPLP
jgi:hypothetical protein